MSDEQPKKKPPVKIRPTVCYMGTGYLLIGDGPDTYHIDLESLFAVLPMAALYLDYHEYCKTKDHEIHERIDATRSKTREI